MKATEILDKFKSILLASDEEVAEVEVKTETEAIETIEEPVSDEVELSEEVQEEVQEELAKEELAENPAPVEAAPVEDQDSKYATKEELGKALAEMKAMYETLMDAMDQEQSMDVPQELSSDVVEEPVTEEPAQEAAPEEVQEEEVSVEPLKHSPEAVVQSASAGKQTLTEFLNNLKK